MSPPPGSELGVWLDDDLENRAAPEGWVHVTKAQEAVALLGAGDVIELSLDHDLGDDDLHGKGVDVLDWLCAQQEEHNRILWPRVTTIHSANASGRDTIVRVIEHYASKVGGVEKSITPSGKPRLTFSRLAPAEPADGLQA